MSKLASVYPLAIEQTKRKILEDIYAYLECAETLPPFEQYLEDRSLYIEQLWLNVWLNKVTNDVPRSEKKDFLKNQGLEIEGMDRKRINRLFRNEMRSYSPFDARTWLLKKFQEKREDWENRYIEARENYKKWQLEERKREELLLFQEKIEQAAEFMVDEESMLLYLHVRDFAAKQLQTDFNSKVKYQDIDDLLALEEKLEEQGPFQVENYTTMDSFFDEVTGGIHQTIDWDRTFFEYETYYDLYVELIFNFLNDFLPKFVLGKLPREIFNQFEDTFYEEITEDFVRESITDRVYNLSLEILEEVRAEYVSDLLALATVPFDPRLHQEIFEKNVIEREKKKAEELAERKRREEAEARMLEDIFGQEYNPSLRFQHTRYMVLQEVKTVFLKN
ncbi:hypothetical protein ACQYAD_11235 [Neobacillus sp. SM06]|uniref:hypothetical protein n=1 Tax=Neobacillus sp. SM06 TaxID=3422492 RepID=UPI003D2DDF0C